MKAACALVLVALAAGSHLRTAPDVSEAVAQESMQNIQIHDGFLAQEQKDVEKEKQVKANKDLSALQTVAGAATAPDVSAKVAQESQENIQIHDQFQAQEQQDIAKEKQVKADKDMSAISTKTSIKMAE